MSNRRRLIRKAIMTYWYKGETVPVDVFIEMTEAGLDVEKLQDQYLNQ